MAEMTKIQWCDHTFNPWIGCTKVSPGCANCYAEVSTPSRAFGVKWGTGQPRRRTGGGYWKDPLNWNRKGGLEDGKRHRVFCASLADWLDDEVPIEWLQDLLKLVYDTPNLDWLLLTKRPENFFRRITEVQTRRGGVIDTAKGSPEMAEFATWLECWRVNAERPGNVWVGTTTEDQKRANERIRNLIEIPARVRFLSVEPMLEEIDLGLVEDGRESDDERSWPKPTESGCEIDWVIVGGESGRGARPCAVEWIEGIVKDCQAAGVACFVKQLGSHVTTTNANLQEWDDRTEIMAQGEGFAQGRVMLKHPKGGESTEWPENLRVRQFPRQ